jgi:hypothetical protein
MNLKSRPGRANLIIGWYKAAILIALAVVLGLILGRM